MTLMTCLNIGSAGRHIFFFSSENQALDQPSARSPSIRSEISDQIRPDYDFFFLEPSPNEGFEASLSCFVTALGISECKRAWGVGWLSCLRLVWGEMWDMSVESAQGTWGVWRALYFFRRRVPGSSGLKSLMQLGNPKIKKTMASWQSFIIKNDGARIRLRRHEGRTTGRKG
jgi:hypothetical protein